MRAHEFTQLTHLMFENAVMGKIEQSGQIVRILKKQHTVPFSSDKDWLLIDTDPAKGNNGLGIKWVPATTRFEWVRPYKDTVDENSLTEIDRMPGNEYTGGQQGVAENFADGRNPVKFTVISPDGYTHSFQITLAVHGKHVGHFNFVRDADTDDVNNEAEVESRWQGQGYGKLLLMKAIDVANNHRLDFQQDIRGITDAQQNVYDSLENAGSIVTPGDGFWFLTPQGEQELTGLNENFADGKNPGRKGLSKRVGVNTKASVSDLRKTAKNSSGEKQRMAHWLANMKAGQAKKKTNETIIGNLHFPRLTIAVDDHAVDRTRTRGISPAAIDQSLKKLSSIADQLAQMEVNNTVWVYDVANNLGMGLRRISSQNMLFKLKTVVGARPYDGVIPIIELS